MTENKKFVIGNKYKNLNGQIVIYKGFHEKAHRFHSIPNENGLADEYTLTDEEVQVEIIKEN